MRKRYWGVLLIVVTTFFAACKNNTGAVNGVPSTLIIGISSGENPAQTKENVAPFRKYLERELGMKVTFYFSTDYTTLIEGMQRKKLDIAQLPPFAYVIATRKPGIIPIAAFGLNHQPCTYHSMIFTSSASGIHNLDDLKRDAKNLTLCFGDPASTSGHLVPRAFLKSIGLDPGQNAFKQTIFAGSHAATIMSVQTRKVDIGCSSNDLALPPMIRDGVIKASDFTILWVSDPIINDAITARSDLDKAFVAKVQKAFLDANTKDSAAFNKSISRYYPNPQNMQYIPIADSAFNGLRKVAEEIKELKQIK